MIILKKQADSAPFLKNSGKKRYKISTKQKTQTKNHFTFSSTTYKIKKAVFS